MTRAVLPSMTHSTVATALIDNAFRTRAGIDTWPRLDTLVRMIRFYKTSP